MLKWLFAFVFMIYGLSMWAIEFNSAVAIEDLIIYRDATVGSDSIGRLSMNEHVLVKTTNASLINDKGRFKFPDRMEVTCKNGLVGWVNFPQIIINSLWMHPKEESTYRKVKGASKYETAVLWSGFTVQTYYSNSNSSIAVTRRSAWVVSGSGNISTVLAIEFNDGTTSSHVSEIDIKDINGNGAQELIYTYSHYYEEGIGQEVTLFVESIVNDKLKVLFQKEVESWDYEYENLPEESSTTYITIQKGRIVAETIEFKKKNDKPNEIRVGFAFCKPSGFNKKNYPEVDAYKAARVKSTYSWNAEFDKYVKRVKKYPAILKIDRREPDKYSDYQYDCVFNSETTWRVIHYYNSENYFAKQLGVTEPKYVLIDPADCYFKLDFVDSPESKLEHVFFDLD